MMNKGYCFIIEDGFVFWILNVYNILRFLVNLRGYKSCLKVIF